MNGRQKGIVVLGFLVAALMALFPPWTRFVIGREVQLGPAGYRLAFAPPAPRPGTAHLDESGVLRETEELRIDVDRLLFQLGVVGFVTVLLAISLGGRAGPIRGSPEPETWTYHRSRNFDADE
jgi:hypothetical protein